MFSQRARDIGLRMAPSATRGRIASHVLGCGLRLIAAGIALGLAEVLAAARLVSSRHYGVRSTDGVTCALAFSVLAAVALMASYIPPRRAMRVDLIIVLR